MNLIQIMKALGDETRLRILNLLYHGELCVCEIEYLLDINQSNASRHLNKLSMVNLIAYEKRALYVYYNINDKITKEHPFLATFLSEEINKLDKCKADLKRLEKYKTSGITCEELKDGKMCFKEMKEE